MLSAILFKAIVFALPCWIENMSIALLMPARKTFPFVARMDRPLDGGEVFLDEPLLGPSRTFLGLLITLILALFWGLIAMNAFTSLKIVLAYFGTLIGSFVKRRLGLPSGKMLLLVDQADYMLFVSFIWYFFLYGNGPVLITSILITALGQPIVSRVAYSLGLKDRPY